MSFNLVASAFLKPYEPLPPPPPEDTNEETPEVRRTDKPEGHAFFFLTPLL